MKLSNALTWALATAIAAFPTDKQDAKPELIGSPLGLKDEGKSDVSSPPGLNGESKPGAPSPRIGHPEDVVPEPTEVPQYYYDPKYKILNGVCHMSQCYSVSNPLPLKSPCRHHMLKKSCPHEGSRCMIPKDGRAHAYCRMPPIGDVMPEYTVDQEVWIGKKGPWWWIYMFDD